MQVLHKTTYNKSRRILGN